MAADFLGTDVGVFGAWCSPGVFGTWWPVFSVPGTVFSARCKGVFGVWEFLAPGLVFLAPAPGGGPLRCFRRLVSSGCFRRQVTVWVFSAPGSLRVFSAPGSHPGASGTWSSLSLAALGGGFVHGLKAVLLARCWPGCV